MMKFFFTRFVWNSLRNKLIAILAVIIGPAVNRRKRAIPISVTRINLGSPLQRIGFPRIRISHFSSFKHAVKEIQDEKQLREKYEHSSYGDELIEITKHVE